MEGEVKRKDQEDPISAETVQPNDNLEVEELAALANEPRNPSEVMDEQNHETQPNAAQRAGRIVSSLLAKEKQNLPEWMTELLAPMDEPDQLAFLLKHRAEINASRRGRVGVPASPNAPRSAADAEHASASHRRVYDTF